MSSIVEHFHCLTGKTPALQFFQPPSCRQAGGARRIDFPPCTFD
jgi:hypothetical protein